MAIQFRGVALDQSTINKFLLAEAWIQHELQDTSFRLSFPQGSYSTSVAASGGTHAGGGVADVSCIEYPTAVKVVMMRYFRACLGFGWHRPYNWDGAGGGEHMHIGELGNPNMSAALRSQVTQWNDGDNGLADWAADTEQIDVKAGRPARIFHYPQVTPKPAPAPPVNLTEKLEMVIIRYPSNTANWKGDFLFAGGKLTHIKTPAAEAALKAAGVPSKLLSAAQFNALFAQFGA